MALTPPTRHALEMPAPPIRRQSGQTLFELAVSIAIGILIIGMTLKFGLALLKMVLDRMG